jgi:Coenzyme PQQ synthesis protein D (PqqD)
MDSAHSPGNDVNFSTHDHVIFTDVDGAEGVLVDLNSKQYYQLNETASLVWRGLANGTPVDGIARELTEVYDVTLEHAQSSVDAIIRNFIVYRLLKPSPQE